jgi:hypothetical protein
MCIPWQWPLWAMWISALPILMYTGLWFGSFGPEVGLALYFSPTAIWLVVSTVIASLETRHTYAERLSARTFVRRVSRLVPYTLINTGMLPHQFSAFCEGLFGPLHSEFERTPKAATVTVGASRPGFVDQRPPSSRAGSARPTVKVHRPYVAAEAFVVGYQLVWSALLLRAGLLVGAFGSFVIAACIVGVARFYGDHVGRRWFVLGRHGK